MVDNFSKDLTWRQIGSKKWVLTKNNNFSMPISQKIVEDDSNKDKKAIQTKKKGKTQFYFNQRKPETKGSLVYTPEGYGHIQDISQNRKTMTVKVNGKVMEYDYNDILLDIPISVKLISSNFNKHDQITVSINADIKEVYSKIEQLTENTSLFQARLYFNGKELNRPSDTIEKLGIIPHSKILAVTTMGSPKKVTRFTYTYGGWGYWSTLDGICFTTSKDVAVIGFAIYTGDSNNNTQMEVVAKFAKGNDVKNSNILYEKELLVTRDENPEVKFTKFYLDRAYRVKAGEEYCCIVSIKSGNSFYGSGGQATSTGEGDVIFNFLQCLGSTNGSLVTNGQVPEIYYYV